MSGPFGSSSFNHLVSTGLYNDVVSTSARFRTADASSLSLTQNTNDPSDSTKGTLSFWLKRSNISALPSNNVHYLFVTSSGTDDNGWKALGIANDDELFLADYNGAPIANNAGRLYRDPTAWMHIAVVWDTTSGTASARAPKLYINGLRDTFDDYSDTPAENEKWSYTNRNQEISIGRSNFSGSSTNYFDGYLADVHVLDGVAVGETSSVLDEFIEVKNGVCIPKAYSGSYGNNGFRLEFKQTGTSANSSGIGADTKPSGTLYHFTVNNFSSHDSSLPDCPENNFCTYNPLDADGNNNTFSQGNLGVVVAAQNTDEETRATFGVSSGKWYWEHRLNSTTTTAGYFMVGVKSDDGNNYWTVRGSDGEVNHNGTTSTKSVSYTTNSVVGVYLDMDNGKWYVSVDGTLQNSADLTNGTGFLHDGITGTVHPFIRNASSGGTHTGIGNFGQDSSFGGNETATSNSDSNGNGTFHSSVFSGYLALCSANLSDDDFATIGPSQSKQANDFFDVLTYSGTNSSQNVTGLDFKPDWVLIKSRSHSSNPTFFDSSRTPVGTALFANLTNANTDNTANFTGFIAGTGSADGGFTVASNGGDTNLSGRTYVAWNWKANGGSASTISADSVSSGVPSVASSVQADTDAGFSIVTFPANNTNATKVAHGLGAVPKLIIAKETGATSDWYIYHVGLGSGKYARFNNTNTEGEVSSSTVWGNTTPDSNTFTIGNNATGFAGGGSNDAIAYCFAEIEGYSKFGSYTGNGSTDGTFVYCGFRPRFFIMFLFSSASLHLWFKYDTKRGEGNQPINPEVYFSGQSYDQETSFGFADFLSNGIKIRTNNSARNPDGGEFIFWAFAEAPFKYANAR